MVVVEPVVVGLTKEIIEDKLKRRVIKVRIDNTFFSKKNYEYVDMYRVTRKKVDLFSGFLEENLGETIIN